MLTTPDKISSIWLTIVNRETAWHIHSQRQQLSVKSLHLAFEEPDWGGCTTKTDVVVVIVRIVVVAVCRSQVVPIVVPTPTAHHLYGCFPQFHNQYELQTKL